MKKALFLSGLLAASVPALWSFDAPVEYPGASFQGISPNGRYLVSSLLGSMTIYDLEADVQYESIGNEYGDPYYSEGIGNIVSNTGVVLGSTRTQSNAAYWENGEWHELKGCEEENLECSSNGITPDASRICGVIGMAPISAQKDKLMMAPVYWDRLPDGTYSDYHKLPYPELDQTGRVPQYVTAICISDDGKTIVGQIRDCIGYVEIPIVYTENADGEWSYTIPSKDTFFRPDMVFPQYPGDGPSQPSAESFLDEDSKAAYDEAFQKYQESGDWSLYPNAENFLTEEAKAAYEVAMEKYQQDQATWDEAYTTYMGLYNTYCDETPAFELNAVRLTPDGKKCYMVHVSIDDSDPFAWFAKQIYIPYAIDIEKGELKRYDFGTSLMVTAVPNNDVVLLGSGYGSVPMKGYVLKDDVLTPVEDYLGAISPELKTWIDENMFHEVEAGYDEETEQFIYENYCFTGNLLASADLSTITMWNDCPWDNMSFACGYVFDLKQFGGVSAPAVAVGDASVSFDAMGNLVVAGDVASVVVYDLSGRCVLSLDAPAGVVANDLAAGVYVAKAVTPAGAVTAKIAK